MRFLMVGLRGLRLAIHLLVGLFLALLIGLDFSRRLSGEKLAHWWQGVLLDVMNVRLVVHGEPLKGSRFTVANHVSWLDIIVIGACEPTRFLAKSEIEHWPVAGWLANACGTFYIRRGKGGARPLLEKLVPHLRAGGSIVVFPEGTTSDGEQVLPFHPRLFAAASESNCPVQPVAIRYGRAADGSNIAPFIGDDDLFSHILRLLKEPELLAEVIYCPPVHPQQSLRDPLSEHARQSIVDALQPTRVADYPVTQALALR
jgi:1-acyl-sn-glycerol-3-phosphate acyltransferase